MRIKYIFFFSLLLSACSKIDAPSLISPSQNLELLNVSYGEPPENYQKILKDYLIKNKLIKKTFNRLKILGSGDLKTKLNIEANFISKGAKIKLDKLGCSVSIKTIS